MFHPRFARMRHGSAAIGGLRMNEDLQYAVLHEFVEPARRNLSRGSWDYLMGGAETETTLERNRRALDSIAFRPRVLRNVENVEHARQGAGPGRAPAGHPGADRLAAGFRARRRRGADAGRPPTFGALHMLSSACAPGLEAVAASRRLSQDLPALRARRHGLGRGSHRARHRQQATSRSASPSISTTTAAASATSPSAISPPRAAATRRTISRPASPGPTSRD